MSLALFGLGVSQSGENVTFQTFLNSAVKMKRIGSSELLANHLSDCTVSVT